MKIKEIRETDNKTLDEKLSELRYEMIKTNAQIAIGTTPKNPGHVKQMKKTIARMIGIKASRKIKRSNEIIKKNSERGKDKKSESNDKKLGGTMKSAISGTSLKNLEGTKKDE